MVKEGNGMASGAPTTNLTLQSTPTEKTTGAGTGSTTS